MTRWIGGANRPGLPAEKQLAAHGTGLATVRTNDAHISVESRRHATVQQSPNTKSQV